MVKPWCINERYLEVRVLRTGSRWADCSCPIVVALQGDGNKSNSGLSGYSKSFWTIFFVVHLSVNKIIWNVLPGEELIRFGSWSIWKWQNGTCFGFLLQCIEYGLIRTRHWGQQEVTPAVKCLRINVFLSTFTSLLVSVEVCVPQIPLSNLWNITNTLSHSLTDPLDWQWVIVPSISNNHQPCPTQSQHSVHCPFQSVWSRNCEDGHVSVSSV